MTDKRTKEPEPRWTRELATEKQLAWLKMLGRAAARARSNLLASAEAKAKGNVLDLDDKALAALPLDEQDARETVRRVLQALFAAPGENAMKLRKAMLLSRAETERVLTTLNVQDGAAMGDPNFNDYQYLGLSELMFDPALDSVAPVTPIAPQDPAEVVKHEVLRFWTELLSKEPAEVEDFHYRVSDYAADRNNSAKLESVLATLRAYAPAGTWERKHVDALARINTESIEFKSLAWLHHPGVIW